MKATINGLEVEGTPEEIERYRVIRQEPSSVNIHIKCNDEGSLIDVGEILTKFMNDTSHIW